MVRVLLCGTSVGGASVVYAAHLLQQEGAAVSGVICENPVAHPERFIEEHMAKILGKLSPRWFWPVCRFFLFLATNVFLLRIGLFWNRHTGSASAVVRHLRVPLLVMHGTADEVRRREREEEKRREEKRREEKRREEKSTEDFNCVSNLS